MGDLSKETVQKFLLILLGALSNREQNFNPFIPYQLDLTSKRMV